MLGARMDHPMVVDAKNYTFSTATLIFGIYRPKTSSQHIFVSRFVFSGQFGHRKHSFTSNLAKKGIICPTLILLGIPLLWVYSQNTVGENNNF